MASPYRTFAEMEKEPKMKEPIDWHAVAIIRVITFSLALLSGAAGVRWFHYKLEDELNLRDKIQQEKSEKLMAWQLDLDKRERAIIERTQAFEDNVAAYRMAQSQTK